MTSAINPQSEPQPGEQALFRLPANRFHDFV